MARDLAPRCFVYISFAPMPQRTRRLGARDAAISGEWTIVKMGQHLTRNNMPLQNGKPHIIYVSAHTFGAYYVWNDTHGYFLLHRGETPKQKVPNSIALRFHCSPPNWRISFNSPAFSLNKKKQAERCGRKRRRGRDLPVTYPPVLALSGKHPVLYSANGSHGLWAAPGITPFVIKRISQLLKAIFLALGRHTYSTFPVLEDFTDQGSAWNTWENLVIVPWNDAPFP